MGKTQMNLTRMGHYFTPSDGIDEETGYPNGVCQTATVVDVADEFGEVNLFVWQHDGETERHTGVEVDLPIADVATFHLSTECPWKR